MRAFRLAYDGRPYHGFQRQPDVPTVEDALFEALRELGVLADDAPETAGGDDPEPVTGDDPEPLDGDALESVTGDALESVAGDVPAGYSAAGRTDTGVSAVAQTVAFEAPDWCHPRALNSVLPDSIRAWAAADVPDGFHATHDATRREYTYHLYAPAADGDPVAETASETGTIDDDRAAAALDDLAGEHDFHNLTPDDAGTVRDVSATLARDGDFLEIRVAAGGFPREFVRRLVAVVEEVASGRRGPDRVSQVLGEQPLTGPDGVGPAPPEPLVLTAVDYPDVEFRVDDDALASAREVFRRRRIVALQRSRVADSVLDGLG